MLFTSLKKPAPWDIMLIHWTFRTQSLWGFTPSFRHESLAIPVVCLLWGLFFLFPFQGNSNSSGEFYKDMIVLVISDNRQRWRKMCCFVRDHDGPHSVTIKSPAMFPGADVPLATPLRSTNSILMSCHRGKESTHKVTVDVVPSERKCAWLLISYIGSVAIHHCNFELEQ